MHQYIAGRLEDGTGSDELAVLDPATGRVVAASTHAGPADVERAVAAARAAQPGWAAATPGERSTLMHKLAGILDARSAELARLETSQTGKPIRLTTNFDVPGTVDNVAFFAGAARHLEGKAQAEYSGLHASSIRREPIGVVGSIAPWNYPLQMAAWKILPAIAAGNTIVLKPAEITPLTALAFAEACTEAGLPDGVVNVVTGRGRVAGEALISHPGVDMVSFTGSTPVGKRIAEIAAQSVKRVHLELGGKAPFVVFDDADLEAAIHGAVAGSLINTGQDCTAATRAYVHRSRFDELVEGVAELFAAIKLGDPNDPATDLGPLSSLRQRDAVAGYIERARGYGAKIVVGGEVPAELRGTEFEAGAYYRPTLVAGVSQDAEIVQQELFGPVLVALPFDSDDEAIGLANDTPFGLAASAWTKDLVRAHKASREIRAGCVWINDHIPIVSEMPHGGYKQSGYGKDMSAYSLEEYTQVKHVMHDITGTARKELAPDDLLGLTGRSPPASKDLINPRGFPAHQKAEIPMPPAIPSPDPDEIRERRSILARAAEAGAMRRTSHTYAASSALSRRNLLRAGAFGGLAVAGAGALSACGVDPKYPVIPESISTGRDGTDYSDTEKIVNFHNWGSYIDIESNTDTSDHPTLDMFKAKYGISVNYVEDITDNNEYYTKLDPDLSAGKDTGVDLMVFSDYMIPILRYFNYIEELDLSIMPNHKNVLPEILNDPIDPGRRFTLPWAYGYTTIAYNTHIVKEPVTSIKELFERPDLRGQVVLFSEMEDTVALAMLALGINPENFTDAQFTDALNYISAARSRGQVRQFMGQDYISSFSQGNIGASMAYSGDVAQLGVPYLQTVDLPTEGMLSWSDNMCIPNFARHKKNAELLMNWYYYPNIAALLDDYIDYIPCVEGAIQALQALDPTAAASPLIVPTAKMKAGAKGFMNLNVDQLNSYTTRFQQISG